jgi:penicillin-binding protein 2
MKKKIFLRLGIDHSSKPLFLKTLMTVMFCILVLRMGYLQIFQYQKYKKKSEMNRIKTRRIDSMRGKIYDKNGVLLVTNRTGYRLVYLKGRVKDPLDVQRIEKLTGLEKKYIEKRIKYGEMQPYTKENILIESIEEKLAHKIAEKLLPEDSIEIEMYSRREYVYDSFASHILGYVKKISPREYEKLKEEGYTERDSVGKDGIERQYDKILRGKPGIEKMEVNAYSRIQRKIEKKNPEQGTDVYLTIDFELQQFMEKLLEKNEMSGSFIAVEPKTGEILTMVSYPTYPLNTFSGSIPHDVWNKIAKDERRPLGNKSIAGEYPPGSVFKPISAISYLKNGIDPNEKYYDPGYYKIGKQKWKSWKIGGHGYVDMKKSLIESANPYYYKLADQFGYKEIYNTAKEFGLGEKTGIDLPGEHSGVIPTPEWKKKRIKQKWYPGDTVNMAIGQGYSLVTPIQMSLMYSILANRGEGYKPHLVKKYKKNNEFKEEKIERIKKVNLPQKYYDLMEDALRRTVADSNGTTQIMRTKGLNIAAKSGSSQNSQSKVTHAWVSGYFPVENPEIVFIAILEGAGGGGRVAGGVAKKFVDKYLEIKNRDNLEKEKK